MEVQGPLLVLSYHREDLVLAELFPIFDQLVEAKLRGFIPIFELQDFTVEEIGVLLNLLLLTNAVFEFGAELVLLTITFVFGGYI